MLIFPPDAAVVVVVAAFPAFVVAFFPYFCFGTRSVHGNIRCR